jgi:hypothetical protein
VHDAEVVVVACEPGALGAHEGIRLVGQRRQDTEMFLGEASDQQADGRDIVILAAVAADARPDRAGPVGDRRAFFEIGENFRQLASERICGIQKSDICFGGNMTEPGQTGVGGFLPAAGCGMRSKKWFSRFCRQRRRGYALHWTRSIARNGDVSEPMMFTWACRQHRATSHYYRRTPCSSCCLKPFSSCW